MTCKDFKIILQFETTKQSLVKYTLDSTAHSGYELHCVLLIELLFEWLVLIIRTQMKFKKRWNWVIYLWAGVPASHQKCRDWFGDGVANRRPDVMVGHVCRCSSWGQKFKNDLMLSGSLFVLILCYSFLVCLFNIVCHCKFKKLWLKYL